MNKTILITGTSSGIGKATAKLFAAKGIKKFGKIDVIVNNADYGEFGILSIINETEKSYFKPLKDPKPVREISLVATNTFSRKLLLEIMSKSIWDFLPESMKVNFSYRKIQ